MLFPPELSERSVAVANLLVGRKEKVAVAESSAGGLIAASLLSVPGASRYYLGGTVIYTIAAASALLFDGAGLPEGVRSSSDAFARLMATSVAGKLRPAWAVAETGAAGPTGNNYGDPAGHAWVAVAGPDGTIDSQHVLTGNDDRQANMVAFATAALTLFQRRLEEAG